VPYVAQAAASHWQDLSEKAERAAHAGGPAFLNVLTNCPLGWGHEPRLAPRLLDAAVDSCFWPLYEVVDGKYRLTYAPDEKVPVDEWLRPQARFSHLFTPDGAELLHEVQRQVDGEWEALVARCETQPPDHPASESRR
jgi:pyruvate ferredoxin oxidoreductase beta subunit